MTFRSPSIVVLALWLVAQAASAQVATPQTGSVPGNNASALRLILIPVTRDGFVTTTMSLPAGAYRITILNRSGVPGLDFQIQQIATPPNAPAQVQSVLAAGMAGGSGLHFSKSVTLTPGTYRVTVSSRPGWLCTIQIQ